MMTIEKLLEWNAGFTQKCLLYLHPKTDEQYVEMIRIHLRVRKVLAALFFIMAVLSIISGLKLFDAITEEIDKRALVGAAIAPSGAASSFFTHSRIHEDATDWMLAGALMVAPVLTFVVSMSVFLVFLRSDRSAQLLIFYHDQAAKLSEAAKKN